MAREIETEAALIEAFVISERELPCTRPDGYHCRIHFDTDVCPGCKTSLAIDRAYRALTGRWIGDREVSQ